MNKKEHIIRKKKIYCKFHIALKEAIEEIEKKRCKTYPYCSPVISVIKKQAGGNPKSICEKCEQINDVLAILTNPKRGKG